MYSIEVRNCVWGYFGDWCDEGYAVIDQIVSMVKKSVNEYKLKSNIISEYDLNEHQQ